MKRLVDVLCRSAPAGHRDDCYSLAAHHVTNLGRKLAGLGGGALCAALGQCPEPVYMDMMMGRGDQHVGQLALEESSRAICDMCMKVMTIVHHCQESKYIRDGILYVLKASCRLLPEFSRRQCSALMGQYGSLVANFLGRYLSPKLCIAFHICPEGLPSDGCRTCQATIGHIKGKVTRHVGQHSMERLLDVLCSSAPAGHRDDCYSLAADHVTDLDRPVSELALEEQPLAICDMCNTVMTIVHNYKEDRNNQKAILNVLKDACRLLPECSRRSCSALVGHYGNMVMDFLVHYDNPNLCITFQLCPKDAAGL